VWSSRIAKPLSPTSPQTLLYFFTVKTDYRILPPPHVRTTPTSPVLLAAEYDSDTSSNLSKMVTMWQAARLIRRMMKRDEKIHSRTEPRGWLWPAMTFSERMASTRQYLIEYQLQLNHSAWWAFPWSSAATYSVVLPQDLLVVFERGGRGADGKPILFTLGVRKSRDIALQIGGPSSFQTRSSPLQPRKTVSLLKHATVETQLFRVSKFVRNEAQGKLSIVARIFPCLLFYRYCTGLTPTSLGCTEMLSSKSFSVCNSD
jgi:hypothetical protein